jgi:hypothetical protein
MNLHLTFTLQRSNPNAPCNVGGKSTQCFIAYRRLQQITRWGSCDRVNWTCPSLKVGGKFTHVAR